MINLELRRIELRSSRMQSEHSSTELQPLTLMKASKPDSALQGKYKKINREAEKNDDRLWDITVAETSKLRDPKNSK